MRKKSPKKLELSVETLRKLDAMELLHAAGGLPWTETCNCPPTLSCQSRGETCACPTPACP